MSIKSPVIPDLQGLSAYEQLRLANIERNQEFLNSLGLSTSSNDRVVKSDVNLMKRSRKRTASFEKNSSTEDYFANEADQPRRRSRRIQLLPADAKTSVDQAEDTVDLEKSNIRVKPVNDIRVTIDNEDGRRKIRAEDIRDLISKTNAAHYEQISDEAIVHTAYRMSYMSNATLANRLKQIARAARSSSYEKLLVFYYALLAANLDNLADSAKEVLLKIKAL